MRIDFCIGIPCSRCAEEIVKLLRIDFRRLIDPDFLCAGSDMLLSWVVKAAFRDLLYIKEMEALAQIHFSSFVTILGVTDSKFKHGSFGGLIIGLTLTLVHIFGIGLTGTSVNPARSLGPAIIAAFTGNIRALLALPVFIIGPFVGAALAAMCYNFMTE